MPFLILDPKSEMQQCINAYSYKRFVDMQCPHCESANVAFENHRAPEVLVVQLNSSKTSGEKDQTEVKKSNVIFFTYGEEKVMEKYVLKAVLCHQGENTGAGHYTTYAKHGNIWYHINYHSVLKPPEGTIITCLMYGH